jgi:hypothetical protein
LGREERNPPKAANKTPWSIGSKVLIYAVVALIISASVVIAGGVLTLDNRGLVFTVYTDREEYSPGERVNVTARFANYGLATAHLTFGTSGKAHFEVYASDDSYVCSIPIMVLMMITKVTIGPGESVRFGASWDQLVFDDNNPSGSQVPHPGVYYILAGTLSSEYHATASTEMFTISDSPQ